MCLPMAPVLPLKGSGDFGTSPIFGQLLDKPRLACTSQLVLPHLEHNSGSKRIKRQSHCRTHQRGITVSAHKCLIVD